MAELTYPASTQTSQDSSTATNASTARFALPAEEFALAGLFERVPNARVECESAVANPADHALLVVHADGERGAVETAIASDSGVATAEFLAEREDGWVYRVTWDEHPHRLIQRLTAADVTILSMRGKGGRWKLRLLAPERDGISRANERMADLDCGADCLRISTVEGGGSGHSLTHEQREALLSAFEAGYYDIPRNVTADELANGLGISHQALSERFRRAYRQIVETELTVEDKYK